MRRLVEDAGLEKDFEIDSAGIIATHEGEPADSRMKRAAQARGYQLTSMSRPVRYPEDFQKFDYLVAMDDDNRYALKRLDKASEYGDKIVMMTDCCRNHRTSEVPDPYYGGPQGFDRVIDLLEDACGGLLLKLTSSSKSAR
jgi:protein-tyrosine phosphatase